MPSAIQPDAEAQARSHIAGVAEGQRNARGTIEGVSMPWFRRGGRKLVQAWTWVSKITGMVCRRIADSHRWPGRLASRISLWRVTETVSVWMVFWIVVATGCAIVVFSQPTSQGVKWLANWGLGGSVGALLAVVWHDMIKSPYTMRRVRRRIVDEPEALLRPTLAEQATKIVELDPPVATVRRDELFDELLPGALARKKDVQIIVGDPGAGKTTALIDLAAVLAKIGLMPVLLEMRAEVTTKELIERAQERFEHLVRPYVKTGADGEIVWRWLCRRRRVVILVDDIDQIGFDGEPGFAMRRLLENVATEGQAVIVTARPAGVPAGIAASAIPLDPLAFETAVDLAARPSPREPGSVTDPRPPRVKIERWVREGDLTAAPLYLEALAELTSVGACPDLPTDPERWGDSRRKGRWRKLTESKFEWNPLWVRYMLLERFYEGIAEGKVRRSLAIDPFERKASLEALEGAALGALGATGREASVAAAHGGDAKKAPEKLPKRRKLVDFISPDDRGGGSEAEDQKAMKDRKDRKLRVNVSQHEAIDTCERLRILEPDRSGDPQFRHRIMQAFLAGRCLAKLGRSEDQETATSLASNGDRPDEAVESFDDWVETLMDSQHPEKLTAHLALTFAAIHADELALQKGKGIGDELAGKVVLRLVDSVRESAPARGENGTFRAAQIDPMREALDPHERADPDDDLIKLTTAANLASLLWEGEKAQPDGEDPVENPKLITELVKTRTEYAMRWTKLQAVPAIAALKAGDPWPTLWEHFTRDPDYDVRRAASKELEKNAWNAYPHLKQPIEGNILHAGYRASNGKALKAEKAKDGWSKESFVALGWVLPAIVSGLSEELRDGETGQGEPAKREPDSLTRAREQLGMFATLAYEGCRPELEESLAQGFKADAMRHAADPSRKFRGPGWVASNRRLVADIALPKAESWYARMLLYQALALYAITGANRDDTMDIFAYQLHRTRERHPLARRAARAARKALRHARFKGTRWEAFIWSDDVEDAGRLPAVLSRNTAQLVGDVAVLVDLKEGSPHDRRESFGHMEELPYCLSHSRDRHEILGTGCPPQCGWGFCPYRTSAPDEPNEHRGISRGFCRGERRLAVKFGKRPPPWQRRIGRRRMREFWEQMEYKARR
ncbi:MAG TPA: hypothetical protein VFJ57_15490 [Solirubrobacterales bacterium]|nr:hypothetical protein [Solirubrobacterales bacterium]